MNVAHVILILQIVTMIFQFWTFYLIWKTQKALDSIKGPNLHMQQMRRPANGTDIPAFDARRRPPM